MYSIEMEPATRFAVNLPDHLQQVVWSARGQAPAACAVVSSGHAPLDEALPGRGWPCQAMTEILQTQAAQGEWQLLAPALRQVVRPGAPLLLIDPPHEPCLMGLWQMGVPADLVTRVMPRTLAERLWVTDQALKADCFGAILAWMPRTPTEALRRLQAVAAQHGGLLFVMREWRAAEQSSAAPLRLKLSLGAAPHPLQVELFKRRGHPWPQPIVLPAWPESLSAILPAQPRPASVPGRVAVPAQGVSHVALDRSLARPVEH